MANTTNFNWETPDDTDLVKDGAAAIRTLGSAIDTSLVDLKGGTTGQILAKNSNTDMDFVWTANDVGDITEVVAGTGLSGGGSSGSVTLTNTVATEFDAKGDLVVGTGADTFDKLTVGANDTILVADSSTATGLKWAAPAGGGKVLQVVSTTKTDTFTTASNSYVDVTGYSVSITPSAATSKILVLYDININGDPATHLGRGQLVRNSTAIKIGDSVGGRPQVTIQKEANNYYNDLAGQSGSYLDSPATTSSLTYKIQILVSGGVSGDIVCVNRTEDDTSTRPRGASTITVMEIGA